MTLTINGFETKENAKAFWSWYTEQGEQEFAAWMDMQCGNLGGADTDPDKPTTIEGDVMTVNVKVYPHEECYDCDGGLDGEHLFD